MHLAIAGLATLGLATLGLATLGLATLGLATYINICIAELTHDMYLYMTTRHAICVIHELLVEDCCLHVALVL